MKFKFLSVIITRIGRAISYCKMKKTVRCEKNNINKEYAKKYLLKYIKELKVHFDLNEDEIKDILLQSYYANSNIYHVIKKIRKIFSRC